MKKSGIFKIILYGYFDSAKNLLSFFLFIALAGIVSLGIVYPLWLFATENPEGYTLFCGILLASALGAWFIYRIRLKSLSVIKQRENKGISLGRKLGRGLVIILLLYIIILLYGSGRPIQGTLVLGVSFFVIGFLLYGPRKNKAKV